MARKKTTAKAKATKKKPSAELISRGAEGSKVFPIPCRTDQWKRWEAAAVEEARLLGRVGRVSVADWARRHLDAAADPSRAQLIN